MSRVASLLVCLLFFGATGCQSNEHTDSASPSWMTGTWTGRLAWEHDTTSYRIRLDLNDEHFVYPTLDCRGTLQVDSTHARLVRMRFIAAHDSLQCGEVSGGVGELHRIDDSDNLHLQYWPRESTKLYLAQLQPQE